MQESADIKIARLEVQSSHHGTDIIQLQKQYELLLQGQNDTLVEVRGVTELLHAQAANWKSEVVKFDAHISDTKAGYNKSLLIGAGVVMGSAVGTAIAVGIAIAKMLNIL